MAPPLSAAVPRRSFLSTLMAIVSLPFPGRATAAKLNPNRGGQPIPVKSLLSYHQLDGQTVTAVYREWSAGDETRCKLCPECSAVKGSCLVTYGIHIPLAEAKLYQVTGESQKDVSS